MNSRMQSAGMDASLELSFHPFELRPFEVRRKKKSFSKAQPFAWLAFSMERRIVCRSSNRLTARKSPFAGQTRRRRPAGNGLHKTLVKERRNKQLSWSESGGRERVSVVRDYAF